MNVPRILVVEDDDTLALEMLSSLQSHGYEVVGHAGAARAALELARRSRPTLALVDVELGDSVDGVDVARELRKQPGTAILYITGHADPETVARAKETAPVAYLMKPFNERELFVTVELAIARQHFEAKLFAEREWLRVTLESIGDAVIATDVDGRVTLANPVAAELVGWTQQEALGRPLDEVFHLIDERSRNRCKSPVSHVLATGTSGELSSHTLLLARDGSERAITHTASPILDARERIIGAVLVFSDITEKLRIDQQMQRAQRLDAVGVLAGGIAHDFNNLLAVMSASVSFATRKLGPQRFVLPLLERALSACDRATGLTKQLLTFANGGAPVRRAAAVGELVRSTVEFALHGSRCRAVFDIAADLMVAEVDEGQIGQVITNLAINAIEATLHGGELQITCANCELGEANPFVCAPGPYVEISIRDHGVGIAPEILPRIFEPYFSTKQQKSGLGLATAYSIAKRHGGALVAESKLGDGATFRMLLPAAPDAVIVERAPEPKTVRPGQRGVRVLVMDDEEALLTALVSMLSDLGFEPEGASDGAQAVRLFQQARELGRPFEVSILDLTVPGGMGGLETLKQLLAIDPRTRAIATSGYAPDPILAQPSRYGFVDSLPKPYRLDELTTAVRRASQQQP